MVTKKVLIVGGGFGGINAAKQLGNKSGFEVVIIDRMNHHLFQPLLYQVAMAGLSPAEIAYPIRGIVSNYKNTDVYLSEAFDFDFAGRKVTASSGVFSYDYLVLACGSQHHYFGHNEWEEYAPGLKSISQATEIRRRVLLAFELAANETDIQKQRQFLTFVIIGGGPTGVELAGAIGEISRRSLNRDFKRLDVSRTRIILLEGANRILSSYSERLSRQATRDLENLGVQVWTNSLASHIDANGVTVGKEYIAASTVLWAAGVMPSAINSKMNLEKDRSGRILVNSYCQVPAHPEVFVIGDQAAFATGEGKFLPGLAPVAIQQGAYVGKAIVALERNKKLPAPFKYLDKGQMATIGRKRAVLQAFGVELSGFVAWLAWLFVHIYYLIGFKSRLFVFMQWIFAYFTYKRGARLIITRDWRLYPDKKG